MNPFKKRSKSNSGRPQRKVKGRAGSSGSPEIISSAELAFSLPSENAFRTSLLMPKMADRFSLLRLDEPGQSHKQGNGENANGHPGMHMRDLSVLEEGDEEDDDLPVQPWGRRERAGNSEATMIPDGMSKEEFMRVRAQEGNSLFSGKQRTFKFRTEDGNGTLA